MRLEDALSPQDRVQLGRDLERDGIALSGWADVEWLRLYFEPRAIEAETNRILEKWPGLSRPRAIHDACHRLGINPQTYERRLREARVVSRGGVKRRIDGAA